MIAISKENYLILKKLGAAGDSFNDVVTEVLKKVKNDGMEGVSKG
jgi:predicted CopG family antitoxin